MIDLFTIAQNAALAAPGIKSSQIGVSVQIVRSMTDTEFSWKGDVAKHRGQPQLHALKVSGAPDLRALRGNWPQHPPTAPPATGGGVHWSIESLKTGIIVGVEYPDANAAHYIAQCVAARVELALIKSAAESPQDSLAPPYVSAQNG